MDANNRGKINIDEMNYDVNFILHIAWTVPNVSNGHLPQSIEKGKMKNVWIIWKNVTFQYRVSGMTLNVSFLIKVWVLQFFNLPLVQDATKLFNKVTDSQTEMWNAKPFLVIASLLHLVLGYALIGYFITFRNKGLH